jgi:hypothetical protein
MEDNKKAEIASQRKLHPAKDTREVYNQEQPERGLREKEHFHFPETWVLCW